MSKGGPSAETVPRQRRSLSHVRRGGTFWRLEKYSNLALSSRRSLGDVPCVENMHVSELVQSSRLRADCLPSAADWYLSAGTISYTYNVRDCTAHCVTSDYLQIVLVAQPPRVNLSGG